MKERLPGGSLRARLALGLCAVLLPFMLAAAVGVFYLLPALIQPLEKIIGEVADEMEPVRQLQVALLTLGVANEVSDRKEQAELVLRVERAFDRVRAAPFQDAERALIDAAWREWGEARSLRKPAGRAVAAHAWRAAAPLDELYNFARKEIEDFRAASQAARTRSLAVTFAAFVLALAISLFAAARLARPLITDVEALRQGAVRLTRGELSHRVGASRGAELGDLAAAFNTMAERIEKDQAALAELATRDGLTGLLNRREFLRLLREELERSRRYRRSCTLLLLDIDRFKTVNDTWGHPAGDAVIRAVAGRVLNEVRPMDRAARYGGEEFAMLLPETGVQGAMIAAERIRGAIAATPIAISSDQAVPVTVSIGVAAYPAGGADEQALISSADKALYAAKQGGRDRVAAAPDAATP
jgi:two-component system, cell cycle response regulator